ncbi:MAG: hypothetical protein ED557_02710 [Balneola sp.]|nr:MAG: hypothetical protein ED557_02710 [Balneola sp.]
MKKTGLILLLTLSTAFTFTPTEIVRRHDVPDSEYLKLGATFPSVCKVGKRGGDCTLIKPDWIITAAHVARGMVQREGNDLKIYFDDEAIGISVEKVFLHPNFQPMSQGDIALIQLKTPIDTIDPVGLYRSTDEPGKEIVIVGHGDSKTGNENTFVTDGKKRGATNVIDRATVDKIVFGFDEPPYGTALEGTAGPGDSGGPAFIINGDEPMIAGISSGGQPGKNGPGTYGATEYYTRVSTYVDWIESVINNPDQALSYNSEANTENTRPTRTVARGRPGGEALKGLGLFLMQDEKGIRIGGKADPLVPKDIRSVKFTPPSYLVSLNGKKYENLNEFKKDFELIEKGDEFRIGFSIQGNSMEYKATKL